MPLKEIGKDPGKMGKEDEKQPKGCEDPIGDTAGCLHDQGHGYGAENHPIRRNGAHR